jgi:hypothetical protein
MTLRLLAVSACLCAAALLLCGPPAEPSLEEGFHNPPGTARPSTYYLWLNHYVNPDYVDKELEDFKSKGIGGILIFDMGARGPQGTVPPAGPAFLSDESLKLIGRAVRTATRLGLEVDFSPISSWDMGGSWVSLEDSSKALDHTSLEVRGPRKFSAALPFPPVASGVPLRSNGRPEWYQEVALLAIPEPQRLPGHEFVFALDPPGLHDVQRVVLYNTLSEDAARDFTVEVSATDARDDAFREVLRATLKRSAEAQEFRFPAASASHIRLRILNSHDPKSDRVQLAEFEVYAGSGRNLAASHQADRTRDGARLLRARPGRGLDRRQHP